MKKKLAFLASISQLQRLIMFPVSFSTLKAWKNLMYFQLQKANKKLLELPLKPFFLINILIFKLIPELLKTCPNYGQYQTWMLCPSVPIFLYSEISVSRLMLPVENWSKMSCISKLKCSITMLSFTSWLVSWVNDFSSYGWCSYVY